MLNGPTYTEFVRHFWIKASVFTEKDAKEEEDSVIRSKPEMKGKTRMEMGLSDFTETEVRSIVLGCLLPRESSTDQMSWDHKHFMTFLLSKYPIDLPAYISQHLCYSINETKKHQKMNVPYARLISEFLYQGKLIQKLAELGLASEQELGTTYGKVFNGSILFNMKLKKKKDLVTDHQFDLVINTAASDYIDNFPLISKLDNPEVIARFIQQFKEDNPGVHIDYDMIPDAPQDIMKKSRKRKGKEAESSDMGKAQKPTKKSRSVACGAAREASELNVQAVLPTRTRKGGSVTLAEARKAAGDLAESLKGRVKTVSQN